MATLTSNFIFNKKAFNQFKRDNLNTDFLGFDFYQSNQLSKLNWQELKQEAVLPQLRAYQRILRVSGDDTTALQLLEHGFDSAHRITAMPKRIFIQQHLAAFSDDGNLLNNIYQKAHMVKTRAILAWAYIKDTMASPHYRNTLFNNVEPGFNAAVQDMPGYQDLFGRLEFCTAAECQSILGAPAYFVDLMRMVNEYIQSNLLFTLNSEKYQKIIVDTISNNEGKLDKNLELVAVFAKQDIIFSSKAIIKEIVPDSHWEIQDEGSENTKSFLIEKLNLDGDLNIYGQGNVINPIPVGYELTERRPDLLDIPLDCENTLTEIPYLQIFNEVAARKIKDLENNPEDFSPVKFMADTVYPFNLPYNQPLTEIRSYLESFKIHLSIIYSDFSKKLDASTQVEIAREYLKLSPEEFAIVTTSVINPEDLKIYFGVNDLLPDLFGGLHFVDTAPRASLIPLLTSTGLTRPQLNQLLFQNLDPEEQKQDLQKQFFINQGLDSSLAITMNDEDNQWLAECIPNSSHKNNFYVAASFDGSLWALNDPIIVGSEPSNPNYSTLQKYNPAINSSSWLGESELLLFESCDQIAVNNEFILLTTKTVLYQRRYLTDQGWYAVNLPSDKTYNYTISITVASNNEAWIVSDSNKIYRGILTLSGSVGWQEITGLSGELVAAGDPGDIWMFGDNKVYYWSGDIWNYFAFPSSLNNAVICSLSVGINKTTCAVISYYNDVRKYGVFLVQYSNGMPSTWKEIYQIDNGSSSQVTNSLQVAVSNSNTLWITNPLGEKIYQLYLPSGLEIIKNLSIQRLDKINRFIRLAAILQWSYTDLDWALRCVALELNQPVEITPAAIRKLAEIKYLQTTYKLSIDVCCSLFSFIRSFGIKDSNHPQDLFDQIFNNPSLLAAGAPRWLANKSSNLVKMIAAIDTNNFYLVYGEYQDSQGGGIIHWNGSSWLGLPALPDRCSVIDFSINNDASICWVIASTLSGSNTFYSLSLTRDSWIDQGKLGSNDISPVSIAVGNAQTIYAVGQNYKIYQWVDSGWVEMSLEGLDNRHPFYVTINASNMTVWILAGDTAKGGQGYIFDVNNKIWKNIDPTSSTPFIEMSAQYASYIRGLDTNGNIWWWDSENNKWGGTMNSPTQEGKKLLISSLALSVAQYGIWAITDNNYVYHFSEGDNYGWSALDVPITLWRVNSASPADVAIRNRLLAALTLQDIDLTVIANSIQNACGVIVLSLENLSLLYRLSTLTQLTALQATDLIYLIKLLNAKQESIADFITNLDHVIAVLAWANKLKSSGFTASEFAYIAALPQLSDVQSDVNYFYTRHSQVAVLTLLNNIKTLLIVEPPIIEPIIPPVTAPSSMQQAMIIIPSISTQLAIINSLKTFFSIDSAVFGTLFDGYLRDNFDLAALYEELIKIETPIKKIPQDWEEFLIKADQLTLLANQLKFTSVEIAAAIANGNEKLACFNDVNFASLSIEAIQVLVTYHDLKNSFKDTNDQLITHYFMEADTDKKNENLAQITHWNVGQIKTLTDWFWPTQTEVNYNTVNGVALLNCCFDIAHNLGVDISFLIGLAYPNQQLDWYSQWSKATLAILNAKYTDADWREVINPINAQLEERKRDGLTNYLVWKLNPNYNSKVKGPPVYSIQDLYNYLLIDPEMCGCASISKIKQAIATAQLYLQRSKMNLEVGVYPNSLPDQMWEWAKSYPVWQANRKVFLYPESYVEPSLRDVKSSIYKELESELMQVDITDENVTKAYKAYLDKLAVLANLITSGSYAFIDPKTGQKTIFLLGRTNTSPYTYYYRYCYTRNDVCLWTPWEKINLPIPATYASPVFAFNRIFLFWVETSITEISDTINDGGSKNKLIWKSKIQYIYLDYSKQWSPPQLLKEIVAENASTGFGSIEYNRIYPLYDETQQVIYFLYGQYSLPSSSGNGAFSKVNAAGNQIFPMSLNANLIVTEWFTFTAQWGGNDAQYCHAMHIIAGNNSSTLNMCSTANMLYDNYFGDNNNFYSGSNAGAFLLKNISTSNFSSSLQTVKNQPGWYIFNNGDEEFLLTNHGVNSIFPLITDICEFTFKNLGDAKSSAITVTEKFPSTYTFSNFANFTRLTTNVVPALSAALFKGGVNALLSIATQLTPELNFNNLLPTSNAIPPKGGDTLDFNGAYGVYFKEIFFFIPFLIANRLGANQQFKEAQRWYQYIFNPTVAPTVDDPYPNCYWRYVELRQLNQPSFEQILSNKAAITVYQDDPFDPDAIAALRPSAYQKAIVMKYIDNLLNWGDKLFTQDTWESITEATLLYVMARDLLGPAPKNLDDCGSTQVLTLGEIEIAYAGVGKPIPEFIINLENGPLGALEMGESGSPDNPNLDYNWYFHVPENTEFTAYWKKVDDRLYKIRHCMNIAGVKRQLSLFEPPLDPRALIRAAALNQGIAAGIGMTQTVLPHYRFAVVIEKAKAMTNVVMQFGSELLSALEKKDAEQLALLSLTQQKTLLNLTLTIKANQKEATQENLNALQSSLASAQTRYQYYQGLLTQGLSDKELLQLESSMLANYFSMMNNVMQGLGGLAFLVPQLGSPFAMTYGGQQVGNNFTAIGSFFGAAAGGAEMVSSMAATLGSFERRAEDWGLQKDLAALDVQQIESQITAMQLQINIAEQDLQITQKSILQNDELEAFYRNKFTNQELYQWMASRLAEVYFQTFQLAMQLGLMAEKSYQFELLTDKAYIDPYAWDSLRMGLLAGEKLLFNLQQLDTAYLNENKRRLEITKTISLYQILTPEGWSNFKNALKEDGQAGFKLDAPLFTGDYSGLTQMAIKTLSISIPAVIGPYQNIHAILTQDSGKTLLKPNISGMKYLLNPITNSKPTAEVLREDFRTSQQIAISTGVNDSGMFVLNFQDERYLPFEGNGVLDSNWTLTMNKNAENIKIIDSMTDIIVNLSYTAVSGGADFGKQVQALQQQENLKLPYYQGERLISLNHEFRAQWNKFFVPNVTAETQQLYFDVHKSMFKPALEKYRLIKVLLKIELHEHHNDDCWVLPLILKIPDTSQTKLSESAIQLNYSLSSTQTIDQQPVSVGHNWFGTWCLEINKADTPMALQDSQGFLDINKVKYMGLSLHYEGEK